MPGQIFDVLQNRDREQAAAGFQAKPGAVQRRKGFARFFDRSRRVALHNNSAVHLLESQLMHFQ